MGISNRSRRRLGRRLRSEQTRSTDNVIRLDDVSPVWRGSPDGPDPVLGIPGVWRGINLVAATVAGTPLCVYERTETGRERLRDHAADLALNVEATPGLSAYDLRRKVTADLLRYGNGLAEIVYDGREIELRPLHAPHVAFLEDPVTGLRSYGIGDRTLRPDEVLHLRGVLSDDGWTGLSFADVCRQAVRSVQATERFVAAFFDKGGRPSLVVKLAAGANTEEQKKRTRKEWSKLYGGGADAAHSVVFSDKDTEVHEMDSSPATDGLKDLREHDLIAAANMVGIPGHLVGAKSNTGYKSTEAEERILLAYGLEPHLRAWESAARLALLTEAEKASGRVYVEASREQLVRATASEQSSIDINEVNAGIRSVNEVRRGRNLPPVPGGDEVRIPVNQSQLHDPPSPEDDPEPEPEEDADES